MFKEEAVIQVTSQNVSIITLQLFNMEVGQFTEAYRPLAMPLIEQLIEDWYSYTNSSVNYQPLIETVKLFLEALRPEVKKALARQIQPVKAKKPLIKKSSYEANWWHISPIAA